MRKQHTNSEDILNLEYEPPQLTSLVGTFLFVLRPRGFYVVTSEAQQALTLLGFQPPQSEFLYKAGEPPLLSSPISKHVGIAPANLIA